MLHQVWFDMPLMNEVPTKMTNYVVFRASMLCIHVSKVIAGECEIFSANLTQDLILLVMDFHMLDKTGCVWEFVIANSTFKRAVACVFSHVVPQPSTARVYFAADGTGGLALMQDAVLADTPRRPETLPAQVTIEHFGMLRFYVLIQGHLAHQWFIAQLAIIFFQRL